MGEIRPTADEGLEVRQPVKAGPRIVGVTFTGKFTVAEGVVQPRALRRCSPRRDSQPGGGQRRQGPYSVAGSAPPDTPAVAGSRMPPCRQRQRGDLRQEDSLDARASRLSKTGLRPDIQTPLDSRPAAASTFGRNPVRAGAHSRRSSFLFGSNRIRQHRLEYHLPHQRPRVGLPSVVLPLEQLPGRRTARAGGRGS
jgi:hypothetical protein